jgi:adenine-specific DNA-methyltransferase
MIFEFEFSFPVVWNGRILWTRSTAMLPSQAVNRLMSSFLGQHDTLGDLKNLDQVIRAIRQHAAGRPALRSEAHSFCMAMLDGSAPEAVMSPLRRLSRAYQDHAVASAYTIVIDQQRRKELGIYFTPPHLVDHLLSRLVSSGYDPATARTHDPAAGGAAFIVPLARYISDRLVGSGVEAAAIPGILRDRLSGMEIEPELADIANILFRRLLREEFALDVPDDLVLIESGDSLVSATVSCDAIVGNPPYGKLGMKRQKLWQETFADVAYGQLNLYAMFVRQALDRVPIDGFVAFVVPTSFIGSPDYVKFRRRIVELADVQFLDVIEKRSNQFLDVIQDACFLVLRKRDDARPVAPGFQSAVVYADGGTRPLGEGLVTLDGSPWRIPDANLTLGSRKLADYGYRASVGHIVPNRVPDSLFDEKDKGRWPLVWAKAITPDGQFEFERGRAHMGKIWVEADAGVSYLIRTPAVVIQRTSNRKQSRRINAAAVPAKFITKHGGFIGENHVIVVVPDGPTQTITPEDLAVLFASKAVNDRFGKMCGTVTVSARLLAQLDLPDEASLQGLAGRPADEIDAIAEKAYAIKDLER